MGIHYDVSNVKKQSAATDAEGKLTDFADFMIYATIFVGIPELTEKNSKLFFDRLRLMEVVIGGIRTCEYNDEKIDIYTTQEEINNFIGMKTNASSYTNVQYKNIINEKALDKLKQLAKPKIELSEKFNKDFPSC